MAPTASARLDRINTVAPSFMKPSMGLGSRTPMHLVHVSNMKLNAQMFSSQCLSIHRRILIRNFLTMLYQQHPIDWIEDSPVDDKDQWLEQTLSAAGIGHPDAPAEEYEYGFDYYGQDGYEYPSPPSFDHGNGSGSDRGDGRGLLEEPMLSPSAAAAASAVTSRRRPQSLRSSNVPLPRPVSMELPVALQSYLSTVFDVDWSVGLANERRPPFGKQVPSPPGVADPPRHDPHAQQDAPRQATKLQQSVVRQDTQPQHDKARDSSRSHPEQSQQTHIHNHHIHIHIHNYPPDGSLSSSSATNSGASTSISTSSERSYPPPAIRSSRYPKLQQQAAVSSWERPHSRQHSSQHSPHGATHDRHDGKAPMSANDFHSYISEFPSPPSKTQSYTTPVAIAAAGPIATSTSTSFASSSFSSTISSSSSAVYPPVEPAGHLSSTGEESHYIATAPPVPSRYPRSPPPPPYTQSFADTPESKYEELSYPRPMKQVQPPTFSTPILTIKPQMPIPSSLVSPSPPYSSVNQKLIEYQQYQERQKMFLRDEETKDSRSGDGLGFIKQLFKQNSKKKKPVAVISAPLPSTTSSLLLSPHTPFLIQDIAQRDLANKNKLSAVPRTRSERML